MTDRGGVESAISFKSSSDDLTSREPRLEIVAIPLDEANEGVYIRGGVIRIQVKRAKVNDNDLDFAAFGPCAGYFTVYPGYVSKEQQPPALYIRTYWIDWCELYRDEEDYFISLRYSQSTLGESIDFDWGTIG